MDGSQSRQGPQVDVEARVQEIKVHMPETYKAIQTKAAEIGREAYAFVRRGISGQANTFYAVERGWVVGTPFTVSDISADMARLMVMFGHRSMVMWGVQTAQPTKQVVSDGAH